MTRATKPLDFKVGYIVTVNLNLLLKVSLEDHYNTDWFLFFNFYKSI